MNKISFFIITFCIISLVAKSQRQDTLSTTLENVKYAQPLKYLAFKSEGQDLRMAYMDVAPVGRASGKTIMLFHGKNFGGYYWTNVIKALSEKGFRVIVPDQIGFG